MLTMATSLNQDDYLKTALRLPRDLHAKIQEAATASGRSMNAEIVARLEKSFEEVASVVEGTSIAAPQVAKMLAENTKLRLEMARLRSSVRPKRKTETNDDPKNLPRLDVILDADGHPISWDEIYEHLRAIRAAGQFDAAVMHTSVITPDLVSSASRGEHALGLREYYEDKLRNSTPPTPGKGRRKLGI
jgi:regulator of replication initiation timing